MIVFTTPSDTLVNEVDFICFHCYHLLVKNSVVVWYWYRTYCTETFCLWRNVHFVKKMHRMFVMKTDLTVQTSLNDTLSNIQVSLWTTLHRIVLLSLRFWKDFQLVRKNLVADFKPVQVRIL